MYVAPGALLRPDAAEVVAERVSVAVYVPSETVTVSYAGRPGRAAPVQV